MNKTVSGLYLQKQYECVFSVSEDEHILTVIKYYDYERNVNVLQQVKTMWQYTAKHSEGRANLGLPEPL